MIRFATVSVLLVLAASPLTSPARAGDDPVREGRSSGKACSRFLSVCAFLKDGSMKPTDECGAQREEAIRILPGECFDAD